MDSKKISIIHNSQPNIN